jgi:hypothetical protein
LALAAASRGVPATCCTIASASCCMRVPSCSRRASSCRVAGWGVGGGRCWPWHPGRTGLHWACKRPQSCTQPEPQPKQAPSYAALAQLHGTQGLAAAQRPASCASR